MGAGQFRHIIMLHSLFCSRQPISLLSFPSFFVIEIGRQLSAGGYEVGNLILDKRIRTRNLQLESPWCWPLDYAGRSYERCRSSLITYGLPVIWIQPFASLRWRLEHLSKLFRVRPLLKLMILFITAISLHSLFARCGAFHFYVSTRSGIYSLLLVATVHRSK